MADTITPPAEATKTAAQINLPQAGQVHTAPAPAPAAEKVSGGTPATTSGTAVPPGLPKGPPRRVVKVGAPGAAGAVAMKGPQGWFKVAGVKGSRAAVAAAIAGTPGIPAHWLAALQEEINNHPSPAVTVDAHFVQQNVTTKDANGVTSATTGDVILAVHIKPMAGYVG